MRVIIVGAGVIGAATAYFVAQRGHAVTLLDRHPNVASETSSGNAGQLSYSYTDTLASPGLLRRLPAILRGKDVSTQLRLDAALLPWGLRFLWYCTQHRADSNTIALLQLALKSATALESLLHDVPLEFGHRQAGKLIITGSDATLTGLATRAALKRRQGMDVQTLDRSQCLAIEPALEGWRSPIAGAVYSSRDDVGDAQLFTRELCNHLAARGRVEVISNVTVTGFRRQGRRVVGVETLDRTFESDAVVMCSGTRTNALLRGVGLRVPIYPLKGYSVTVPLGASPPHVSLTDLDQRIVFAHLNGRIRLAGFVDFVGSDASIDARRIAKLVGLGKSTLPDAGNFDGSLQEWAGLRPATPSGLPIVGATRVPGLYLNVGHGGLGWTLACGAAQALAEQL